MSAPVERCDGGVRLHLHVQPGAKRTEFAGRHGDAIKIRVHAPPVEGKANDELIRFLSEAFSLTRANVVLVRGDKSRAKVFDLRGAVLESVTAVLASTLGA